MRINVCPTKRNVKVETLLVDHFEIRDINILVAWREHFVFETRRLGEDFLGI